MANMSNLIEQILAMEAGTCDAIMLQLKHDGDNGEPHYAAASAIIRRLPTIGGVQWAYHTMYFGRTGSGMYGDIDEVVNFAEKIHGIRLTMSEWVQLNYKDEGFPHNLIPPGHLDLEIVVDEDADIMQILGLQ